MKMVVSKKCVYALGNVNKKTEEDTKKLSFTHNMNTEKLVGLDVHIK